VCRAGRLMHAAVARCGAVWALALLSIAVGGCQTAGISGPPEASAAIDTSVAPARTLTVQEPTDVKYYRSDEPLRLGLEHFDRGHFGIAERYLRDAVEKAPRDASAWIALAATYDRLARFDLADRAYRSAIGLVGETTQVLNNLGYSYMLRGKLVLARKKFMQAYAREPDNPMIANNLQLLDASSRYISRAQDVM
jgi:Flp pilus assembly protein TadD